MCQSTRRAAALHCSPRAGTTPSCSCTWARRVGTWGCLGQKLKIQLAAHPCSSFLCEQCQSMMWLQHCCWFQLCVLAASPLHVAHWHFLVSRSEISPSGICHHCACTHFVKGKLFGCNAGRVLGDLNTKVGGFISATSIKFLPILSHIDTSHYVMTCLLETTLLLCTTISDMSSSDVETY